MAAVKLLDWWKHCRVLAVYRICPVNKAFDMLPAGTVDNLLKPENKQMLTGILTYHVVAGKWNADAIAKLIKEGNGTAEVKTVAGGKLY